MRDNNMTIDGNKMILITYKSGYISARFKDDPDLLDTLIEDHTEIDDIQTINFEGRGFTPERAVREIIRSRGKQGAREFFEEMLEGGRR